MSGVVVINYLLSNDAGVTALVSADKIRTGMVSQKPSLPAISISKISASQQNTLAMSESSYIVIERVQVSAHSQSYSSAAGVLDAVRAACVQTMGVVNGVNCQSVTPQEEGVEIYRQETGVWTLTQDYMVGYLRSYS